MPTTNVNAPVLVSPAPTSHDNDVPTDSACTIFGTVIDCALAVPDDDPHHTAPVPLPVNCVQIAVDALPVVVQSHNILFVVSHKKD